MGLPNTPSNSAYLSRAFQGAFIPAALTVLTVCIVSPIGNFPLNDDWVYATMVRWLAYEGRLQIHPYTSAYSVTQTLWGALWVLIFGFSYTTLRISSIVLWFTTSWAVALCAKELGASRKVAAFTASVVLVNPLVINLAYGFMTETPFMACMAWSILFHLKAMRSSRATYLAFASAFGDAALLNRQFGALIPVAFFFALLANFPEARKHVNVKRVVAWIAPWCIAAPAVLYFTFGQRFNFRVGGMTIRTSGTFDIAGILGAAITSGLYLGLFLLPLTLWIAIERQKSGRLLSLTRWCVFMVVLGAVFGMHPHLGSLPNLPNLLYDFGVGPLLLRDAYELNPGWTPVKASPSVWRVLTLFAAISFAYLAVELPPARARTKKEKFLRQQHIFLLLLGVLLVAVAYNPSQPIFFDRYLVPAIVPLAILASAKVRSTRFAFPWVAALVCCAVFYAFGVASLHDYLAWNRARWAAIDSLRTKYNVADTQIDGGYEFNGPYTSETYIAHTKDEQFLPQGIHGWWRIDDTYAVSFTPRDGYTELESVPYYSWLSFSQRSILALKRTSP